MLSPRRTAQVGLGAALLLLLSSVSLLHSGASAAKRALRAQPFSTAPGFVLPDPSGNPVSLLSHRGQTVLLCLCSVSCPVSNDYRERLAVLTRRYASDRRVSILWINTGHGLPSSNADLTVGSDVLNGVEPQNPAAWPLLMDPDFEVANRYAVDITPTFFVIDAQGVVRYRGSFDDNRNTAQVKARYCQDALEDVLHHRSVAQPFATPFGCALR